MTDRLGDTAISLPLWEDLTDEMIYRVVGAVAEAARAPASQHSASGAVSA
jgi:dTDP-4-amino-4,6-dideoxygalactose transaminase